MATLYIDEYTTIGPAFVNGSSGVVQGGQEPAIASQIVAISGSSTQSTAFNANTVAVRLHCDTTCSVAFGLNPTATTNMKRMAANQTEYWPVQSGHKVAVIANV